MAKLPLDEMTTDEKLEELQAIWDDLCKDPDQVPAPRWHAEILAARKAAVERGEGTIEDWESAKRRILKETS